MEILYNSIKKVDKRRPRRKIYGIARSATPKAKIVWRFFKTY